LNPSKPPQLLENSLRPGARRYLPASFVRGLAG
jgi:hypothetical protein